MNGQGTVAYELMNQVPDLDAILVSVSGGGLISGRLKTVVIFILN
jgi:threonine dehydratase